MCIRDRSLVERLKPSPYFDGAFALRLIWYRTPSGPLRWYIWLFVELWLSACCINYDASSRSVWSWRLLVARSRVHWCLYVYFVCRMHIKLVKLHAAVESRLRPNPTFFHLLYKMPWKGCAAQAGVKSKAQWPKSRRFRRFNEPEGPERGDTKIRQLKITGHTFRQSNNKVCERNIVIVDTRCHTSRIRDSVLQCFKIREFSLKKINS